MKERVAMGRSRGAESQPCNRCIRYSDHHQSCCLTAPLIRPFRPPSPTVWEKESATTIRQSATTIRQGATTATTIRQSATTIRQSATTVRQSATSPRQNNWPPIAIHTQRGAATALQSSLHLRQSPDLIMKGRYSTTDYRRKSDE
jgi:hypothetical protein